MQSNSGMRPSTIIGLSIGFLLLVSTLIYSPVRNFDYLAIDDAMHTEANPRIHPLTLENVSSFWKNPYENAYTPITYSLWALLAHLGKNSPEERELSKTRMNPEGNKFNPGVFHFANFIIHCLAVVSVFFLLRLLFQSTPAALVGSTLFAVHPLQVETVCWITGLRDVLAGLLSILSIYFYLKYIVERSSQKTTRIYYSAAFGMFFFGVLCKSSALMAPPIAGLLGFFYFQRKPARIFLDFVPWALLLIPVMRVFYGLNDSVALKVVHKTSLPERILIAGDAITFYLYKLFFPIHLTMDYGRTPQFVLGLWERYLTGLFPFVFGGLSLLIFHLKKFNLPLIALGIFILGLGPVLGITPFIFQHISTTADRYVYLSLLGPCLALATLFSLPGHVRIKTIAVLALVSFTVKSQLQLFVWKNNLSLFSQTLEQTPESWLASNDLGTVLEGMGRFGPAMSLYERSAEIANIPSAWNNAGAMAVELKDYDRAVEFFELAVKSSNGSSWAYHNLGAAYLMGGNQKKAMENYSIAQLRDDRYKYAHKNPKILRKDDGRQNRG